MQKIKVDMSIERKFITLFVMNDEFIQKMYPIVNPSNLSTQYAKEVATWCAEFYASYQKAPGAAIQDIFISKREYLQDDDTIKSIGEFLSKALAEYDPADYSNLHYYIDASEKHLRRNSINDMTEKLTGYLTVGDVDKCEQLIANYTRIAIPATQGVSIISDTQSIKEAFLNEQEVAFRFPGDLGIVIGNVYRGDLVGWVAPFKAGKTWALLYSAEQAMLSGRRVLVVSLEMRMDQLLKRAWQAITASPTKSGVYQIPYFYKEESVETDGEYTVAMKDVRKEAVDLEGIEGIQKRIRLTSRGGDIRFMCMPSKVTTVASIEAVLDNLMYYENYAADVVVLDYADILGAAKGFKGGEYRHLMDDIWSNLRRVAQERNISILTASQVNRAGIEQEELSSANLAEDIRKAGHVSKLIGLSRPKAYVKKNMARVSMLFERDEPETFEPAVILQQYAFGRFCIDSKFASKIDMDEVTNE
jgi:replicative DNA helicase